MMRFIRNRTHVNAERLKLQKELFQFNQTLFHGFPHRPSALAFDKKLNLLAIGTRDGHLRVLGAPGVEFYATIDHESKIDSIVFVENAGQLIVKCEDNSIHLFEIPNNLSEDAQNSSELILIKVFEDFVVDLESDDKITSNRITTLTVHSSHSRILIATEDGTIHFLNAKKFELEETSISLDKVQSQLPSDQPKLLGAAEQIIEHPLDSDRILIGYNRGQLILWNLESDKLERFYSSGQQLESICWSSDTGDEFISSHNDGSYIVWNIEDNIEDNIQPSQQSKITYGPFPCKPINKIYGRSNDNLIIFSGGMPRQLHGERHTVSIIQGIDSAKHQVLDLTSKVIDFVVLEQNKALIVLAEEELIAIDLNDTEWSQFRLPYLSSVHSSPITFSQIYSDISDALVDKLKDIGFRQTLGKHSNREWPIQGGILKEKVYSSNNVLLITGHENGSVRIWNVSDCAMSPLCTINTAKYFGTEDDIAPIDQDDEQDDGDEWPPFKKVGIFDPYSDDPRLGIRKAVLCPKTFNLLVAGTAGQIIIFELKDEPAQLKLTKETIDLVQGLDFIWKSHECLPIETGLINIESGYQPRSIVQLNPPASITALALHSEWGLLSAGTTHGFAVFSYELNKSIAYKCTLNPAEISNISGSGNLITRKKSFRKSLRESFRRLRKGRSMRLTKKGDKSPSTSPTKGKGSKPDGLDSRPIERQVEAKTTEDGIGSVVRCLYFANAPIISQAQFQCTLFAGTNAGNVFIYLINDVVKEENSEVKNNSATTNESTTAVTSNTPTTSDNVNVDQQQTTEQPVSTSNTANEATTKTNEIEESPINDDKPSTPNLTCILTKEIQLKHHAPVIFIQIIDSLGHPVEEKPTEEQNEQHVRVLICSDEQFKLFNLPTLKPYCKFKLTAQEGAKSRCIHVSKFVSRSDSNYSENCIVNITNQGDVGIYSILDLKRQLNSKCAKKEDFNGIASLVFANNGEGIFLNSPSEFSRFSLSAQRIVKPNCLISETNLENRIVIEIEKVEEPEPVSSNNEQANQSSPDTSSNNPTEQLNNQTSTTSEAASSSTQQQSEENRTSSTNKETNTNSTTQKVAKSDKEKPKNVLASAKVTEVKTRAANIDNEPTQAKLIELEEVLDKKTNNTTVPKEVEEHAEVKLVETIRDCSVKQSCSIPANNNQLLFEPVVSEMKTQIVVSNGTDSKQSNLVDVEVHQNGNGLNGNNHMDEDEGEGKSLEEDLFDKSEDIQEKSNGTPTSGIVSVEDVDDSFSDPVNDLNDLMSSNDQHFKPSELKRFDTTVKDLISGDVIKNKRWSNLNETTEIKTTFLTQNESANNSSLIDNSLNLTNDITVDSIKEHFNNLSLRNDDLLDHNDDFKFN